MKKKKSLHSKIIFTITIIFTICLIFVVSLYGQKEKRQELTLDQMRAEIARQSLTFTVGKTSVSDVPLENLCGLVEPSGWQQTGKFDGGYKGKLSLPSSWDWRDQGVVTDVQDRGSCGSCWAFGTIGSYESCAAVTCGKLYDLSEQWLLDCNTSGYGCDGGWWGFDDMYDGVPLDSDYPYVGSAGLCKTDCHKYFPMEAWYYVGTSSSVPSVSAIKNAIYEHGPIAAAVCADYYFQNYPGGYIFTHTSSSQPNRGVVLVGWNDSGGYWILKNSRGTGWGENGYMRIAYGANSVGYAAAYGVPLCYCKSSGNSQTYEWIARVKVADLDNSSGPSGYSDFTYLTANLTRGLNIEVSLTPGFSGSTYTEYWRIWIDYNHDCDFFDPGEEVFPVPPDDGSGTGVVTGNFIVPEDASIGQTRMRVGMKYNSYLSSPCGTFTYGEIEDYTVNISNPPTGTVGNTTVFPNISTSPYRRAMPFTMPEDGTITSISMFHEKDGSGNMILAVYDGEDSPQNRLGITEITPVSGSKGWQTIDLISPPFVYAGSTVWLAWVYSDNPGIRYQTGSPGRYQSTQTWSGGMPDPFGSGTQANYLYSIYATYYR